MSDSSSSEQVLIIGGGIAGLSAAASLTAAGLPVMLFESAQIGTGASSKNQGWLHSGGLFAVEAPDLARMCFRSLTQTLKFCSRCLDSGEWTSGLQHQLSGERGPHGEGMYYLFSGQDSCVSDWTTAWRDVGIPFTEIAREEFLRQVPDINHDLVQRAFLLPDRVIRPQVLLEELAAAARNAGAEIRTYVNIAKLIVRDGTVRGIVTETGEQVFAGHVVLATGGLSQWGGAAIPHQPLQDASDRQIPLKTHLIALRPELAPVSFVFVDRHGLNHLVHQQTSVFESGRWNKTTDPMDHQIDPDEIAALWQEIGMIFPACQRSLATEVTEWAGTTVQGIPSGTAGSGKLPWPVLIDHGAQGGLHHLWSIFPGRATLSYLLADELRQQLLSRIRRPPFHSASPPWAI